MVNVEKNLRRFLCLVMALSVGLGNFLFVGLLAVSAWDAAVLTVDTSAVIQNDFLGANAIYHAYAYRSDELGREYNDAQRDIEFNRIADMELGIARTYYDVDYAWYNDQWDWNSPNMQAMYKWMDAMKDRNVDVALNAAWGCPSSIDSSSHWPLDRSPLTVDGNWEESVKNYAAWITETVRQIFVVRGYTNLKYLVMFTEPNNTARQVNPDGSVSFDKWLDCVKAAHDSLVAAGLRDKVKLVGPNEGSTSISEMVGWAAKNANQYIDIYSSHNYEPAGINLDTYDTYDDWYRWVSVGMSKAESAGKPFWFDEYGTFDEGERLNNPWYGTAIATAQAAFMNAGAQTSLLWTLFDQQWPNNDTTNGDSFYNGMHKHGIAPSLLESEIPRKSYYVFSMISKYMGSKGTKVYKTTGNDGVYVAASKTLTGDWNVLVVNTNQNEQDFNLNFSTGINRDFYRHLYDPMTQVATSAAMMIYADKTYEQVSKSISDLLPAGGVAIYTTRADFDKNKPQILQFSTDKVNISDTGVNLIGEGGFENLPQAGTSWNVDTFVNPSFLTRTSEKAASGNTALKWDAKSSQGAKQRAVMTISVKPYTNYVFSAAVMGLALSSQNKGNLTFGAAVPSTGNYVTFLNKALPEYAKENVNCTDSLSMTPPAWDGQWHRRGSVFNTGTLDKISIVIRGDDTLAYLDDFILCELKDAASPYTVWRTPEITSLAPEFPACKEKDNLFKNAGFTSDSLSFWKEDSLFDRFFSVKSDPKNLKNKVLSYNGGSDPSGYMGQSYMRWVDVKADTQYTFTCFAKGFESGNAAFGIMDNHPAVPQNIGEAYTINDDELWELISFSFNSKDSTKIGFYFCDAGGEVFLDNIQLFEAVLGVTIDESDYNNPNTGQYSVLVLCLSVAVMILTIAVLLIIYRGKVRPELCKTF